MYEQSKAAKRRFYNGKFHSKYFVGEGLDIGSGNDSLNHVKSEFRGIKSVKDWDLNDGDAQYLSSVEDNTFDFIHSSHCLEHMVDWGVSLINWVRVVKKQGFIIITVPHEHMYEHNKWPSRFNSDHKWSFRSTKKNIHELPKSLYMLDVISFLGDTVLLEKIEVINEFYYSLPDDIDQTMLPNTECCIEYIFQKI